MKIQNETDLIIFLAGSPGGGCSLNSSPKKNWVEKDGGLPNYICEIARAIMRSGKSKSSAISIAISRTKMWAAGGSKVDADTRAKAAAAVAEWEALKAKAHGKDVVRATRSDGTEFIQLSALPSFNTDMVRIAWRELCNALAQEDHAEDAKEGETDDSVTSQDPDGDGDVDSPDFCYSYIMELWSDFILVETDNYHTGGGVEYYKVPYTVTGVHVEFGDPVEVEKTWTPVDKAQDDAEDNADPLAGLSDNEKELLEEVIGLSADSPLQRLISLARK